jgi:CRP/FNR family transcriptional regulator, cyclic AMP receptor protein
MGQTMAKADGPRQPGGGFWDALTAAERTDLGSRGKHRTFEPESIIFREDDPSVYVLIILSGWVKASLVTFEGHEIILGVRGPSDMVGERAALWSEPRSADVRALNEVRGLVIPGDQFIDFLDNHRSAERALTRLISNRLDEAVKRLRLFGSAGGAKRLAGLLLELAERHGTRTAGRTTTITLPLSQEELAGWCNCSRETVARALRPWRQSRVVHTARRQITILDAAALRELAGDLADGHGSNGK